MIAVEGLTLGVALGLLRAAARPSVGEALHVLGMLDTTARRLIRTPQRRCKGTRCPFTNADWWHGGNVCKCEQPALALRLLAMARSDVGVSRDAPLVLWHKATCVGCGCEFRDRREGARYCPYCTNEIPSLRKAAQRKRGK